MLECLFRINSLASFDYTVLQKNIGGGEKEMCGYENMREWEHGE